jgi:hypothetical protein
MSHNYLYALQSLQCQQTAQGVSLYNIFHRNKSKVVRVDPSRVLAHAPEPPMEAALQVI